MNDNVKDDLQHIRKMMEQSSRFISLSGLSGVVAGVVALVGVCGAWYIFKQHETQYISSNIYEQSLLLQLILLAIGVLVLAIVLAVLITINKTKRLGLQIWTSTTRKLVTALFTPLLIGGLICIAALYHGYFIIVAPLTLVFYGLALVNAGKYTFSDIQNLGYCEAFLGIVAMFLPNYGLLFWALGFGVLHIVYGLLMYKKYQ